MPSLLNVFAMFLVLLGLSPRWDFGTWGNVLKGGTRKSRDQKGGRIKLYREQREAAGIAQTELLRSRRRGCTILGSRGSAVLCLILLAKKISSILPQNPAGQDVYADPSISHADDFDVSIFLTELSTPHSILTRQKLFNPQTERMQSNSAKMTGTREEPMDVDIDAGAATDVVVRQESQDEESMGLGLGDIPPTVTLGEEKREKLFVSDSEDADASDASDEDGGFQTQKAPPKRPQLTSTLSEPTDSKDDKKKMGLRTTYDGFRIYGRILCLVVKRKGLVRGKVLEGGGGQAMMETFISTQVERQGMGVED